MPDSLPHPLPVIEPDWDAPANVLALCTTRPGGCSAAPYDNLNLGAHVGDDPACVAANRARLAARLPAGAVLAWLDQVHGAGVVEAQVREPPVAADAHWSRAPGVACAVLTADCLPVLFCAAGGDVVAAAHAGWRGLQAGVLEATLAALGTDPGDVLAWLGPAIGPAAFEVGPEVRAAFLQAAEGAQGAATAACFRASQNRPGHWFADLYGLARLRLAALGVTRVSGARWCTHGDRGRFFSHRRDGPTGRMASLVLLR